MKAKMAPRSDCTNVLSVIDTGRRENGPRAHPASLRAYSTAIHSLFAVTGGHERDGERQRTHTRRSTGERERLLFHRADIDSIRRPAVTRLHNSRRRVTLILLLLFNPCKTRAFLFASRDDTPGTSLAPSAGSDFAYFPPPRQRRFDKSFLRLGRTAG